MYQHASSRKLKIYSKNEIQLAKGLEKVRRQFWNTKGEEVCRDKTLRTWPKTVLHGVIDTLWTLKKTALLAMEANKILNEKIENIEKTKQREGTLTENLERTLAQHNELLRINSKLAALNDPNNTTRDKKSKVENLQRSAREAIGELKRAQESARKAMENRGKSKSWSAYDVPEEVLDDTAEPTPEDIAGMLKAVLERTLPKPETVGELSDDDKE